MGYSEEYSRYVGMIEETLEQLVSEQKIDCPADGGIPAHLCETMRYSLLAGGKRVRPVLLLAACQMLGGDLAQALVPAAALELPDGRVVTGKTGELLGACAALLLNTIKELAGIADEVHLVSPSAIQPIQHLKTEYLGSRNPRLHSDEVLIALSASAAENPLAQQAMEQLSYLKGSMAHASVKLSSADYKTFRKLGIDLTYEPVPEQK